jgi:hypothetical protein
MLIVFTFPKFNFDANINNTRSSVADPVVFSNSAIEYHHVMEQFVVLDLRLNPRKKLRRFRSAQGRDQKSKLTRIIQIQDAEGPAPAVDPSKHLPNIIHSCLSESDVAHLWSNAHFTSGQFRAHQISRFLEFAFTELHIALSSKFVGRAFEIRH